MIRPVQHSIRAAFAALGLMAASAGLDAAKADPYRWCADYMGGALGGASNCGFITLEQCRATVSGVGGYCRPNAFYDGLPIGEQPRRVKPRRM